MSLFPPDFLDWFARIDHHDLTQKELAWEAWREGQHRLANELIPELVDANGEVGVFRENTMKTTERLTIQLASIVERAQCYAKG
jgi:hypothetical protein